MKNLQYILSSLALVLIVNVGVANTTVKEKKTDIQEQEQEGRRKADPGMIRPDAETPSEPIDQNIQEDSEVEQAKAKSTVYTPDAKLDTVKEESVSKYNFIFYFLYKFKYDGEESP
ncbi:hypothetical protein [Ekhidna sp.]|uniref:hypothetical protein n=1 Tax=Ekhidna sp. TaxID=2608089 RepID=UPI00329947CF